MKKISDLVALIKDCNIVLDYQPLPNHICGFYNGSADLDLIVINTSITEDDILHKMILAEEVGHYFTTIGDNTPKKIYTYSEQLRIEKCEVAAMKWASNYLIPTHDLIELIANDLNPTLEACYDYFGVSKELMLLKFEYLSKVQTYWSLKNDKLLTLASLPSIYIIDIKNPEKP